MPDIQLILSTNGYSNAIVTTLGKNQYRILIKGEVYIGQIKELFNVCLVDRERKYARIVKELDMQE